jgi:DNA-binding MarR family transcriptional regulator
MDHQGRIEAAFGTRSHDAALIERLDRALLRMRRTVVRPQTAEVPIPALGRTVDVAKIGACLSIADLESLNDPAEPVTVKDVAAALNLEHSTASRLLADAEAEGLVTRSPHQTDRRRTVVQLSETGRAVVEQSATIRGWVMDAFLAEWTATELSTFADLVERFSTTIEARGDAVIAAAIQRVHDST